MVRVNRPSLPSVAPLAERCSGQVSLRNVISNLKAQSGKLYHLGCGEVNRSSLARVNAQQPHSLYDALFGKLFTRCQSLGPKHRFRFKHKLYSLDASTVDLCLSVFPWAKYRSTKGAVKLHVGLDHDGYLPAFVRITEGRVHEVNMARTLELPSGSIVVFERGYTDYEWYNHLNRQGIYFATLQKKKRLIHGHRTSFGIPDIGRDLGSDSPPDWHQGRTVSDPAAPHRLP